jgi:hypothetical protein
MNMDSLHSSKTLFVPILIIILVKLDFGKIIFYDGYSESNLW